MVFIFRNTKMFQINSCYGDIWALLSQYMDPDDAYSMSLTCKQAWRAAHRPDIAARISYPLLRPHRLTYEQREVVRAMEQKRLKYKLISGDVGSGKTMVSISYAIRNYISKFPGKYWYKNNNRSDDTDNEEDSDSELPKIIMCCPPSLIKMWWTTLVKYFGIKPAVLHSTNSEYKSGGSWDKVPKERFILISYMLLNRHGGTGWFRNDRDLLIMDEAHHRIGIHFQHFKECVGLSATIANDKEDKRKVRHLEREFSDQGFQAFELHKTILAKRLPGVRYHGYMLPVLEDTIAAAKEVIRHTKKGEQDVSYIPAICKILSHPLLHDLRNENTGGYIMVGRKSFQVIQGSGYWEEENKIRMVNPFITHVQLRNHMMQMVTFDIAKVGPRYSKYLQAYHVIKEANAKGEKVILFDTCVSYLPFLHKFLTEHGIESYMFTTHYGTADRQKQLTKFQESKTAGVLLSSIAIFGEGQNCTEANHVIFFTQMLDGSKYYQAIGRAWRYPQNKEVQVHLFFCGQFDLRVYEHACMAGDIREYDWHEVLEE